MKNMVYCLLFVLLCSSICSFSMDIQKLEKQLGISLQKEEGSIIKEQPDTKEVASIAQEIFGDDVPIILKPMKDKKDIYQGKYKIKVDSKKNRMIITEQERDIEVLKNIFQSIKDEESSVKTIIFKYINR